jgi:TPR repeat protein
MDEAVRMYRSTCGLNEPEACIRLGAVEERIPGNAASAIAHYEQACADAPPTGCRLAGSMYARGAVPLDLAKAAARFTTGCDAGDGEACAALGDLHRLGRGRPRDLAHALTLYDRGCNAGFAPACVAAGQMYAAAGRVDESRRAYERGCRGGNQTACDRAGGAR